ncbi:MAG: hypothetical protein ACFFBP_17120 [Promethearchaeota archaeon]
MSDKKEELKSVVLRTFPKIIFFYPLFLVSFLFWIIQAIITGLGEEPNAILGYIWFITFFINLFIIGFDFPFNKFLILMLGFVITILIIIFGLLPNIQLTPIILDIGSSAEFYAVMTLVLGIILGFVFINARFNYYEIERNEVFHITGIFTNTAERYPVRSLRVKHTVSDVFEFILLGAGAISLYPKDSEPIHLYTVIRVKSKMKKIDWLLSHLAIQTDNNIDNVSHE